MRAIRRTSIVLVVLCLLLLAADRAAHWFAEDEAASQLDGRYQLTSKPEVTIKGFPFLTQLAAGEFEEVRLTAPSAKTTASGADIAFSDLDVTVNGLRPTGDFSGFSADRASGSAVIGYEDFNKILGRENTSVAYGGTPGRLRFSTSVEFLGQSLDAKGTATVKVQNGDTLTPSDIRLDNAKAPGLASIVTRAVDMTRKLTELPVGLKLKTVMPREDGVHIALTGTDLSM